MNRWYVDLVFVCIGACNAVCCCRETRPPSGALRTKYARVTTRRRPRWWNCWDASSCISKEFASEASELARRLKPGIRGSPIPFQFAVPRFRTVVDRNIRLSGNCSWRKREVKQSHEYRPIFTSIFPYLLQTNRCTLEMQRTDWSFFTLCGSFQLVFCYRMIDC